MRHRQDGFTVIELMTTMAVASILALTVIASWSAVQDALGMNSAKGAAEQLAEAIRATRQRAITNASNFCIGHALDGGAFMVEDVGQGAPAVTSPCPGTAIVEGPTALVHQGRVASAWSFTLTPVSTAVAGGAVIPPTGVTVTANAPGSPATSQRVCVNGAGGVTVLLDPAGSCS
jgi:prepilin-type N-terminal cleavage/methylation domain-containing protein